MEKLDLKKDLKYLYAPSAKKVEEVDVPVMNFVMIDGAIEPDMTPGTSPRFAEDMQALYGAAYTLKFAAKLRKLDPLDYPVMALEGLWWVEDGTFDIQKPGNWKYTVMIMQPDQITLDMFSDALAQLRRKKGDLPAYARLRLESFLEGLSVQTIHIGPYASEPATVERMQAFMQANGFQDLVGLGGKHHEIYLGDPRRADPAKLKTVLRHPVKRI
jgi:hypothetical protein